MEFPRCLGETNGNPGKCTVETPNLRVSFHTLEILFFVLCSSCKYGCRSQLTKYPAPEPHDLPHPLSNFHTTFINPYTCPKEKPSATYTSRQGEKSRESARSQYGAGLLTAGHFFLSGHILPRPTPPTRRVRRESARSQYLAVQLTVDTHCSPTNTLPSSSSTKKVRMPSRGLIWPHMPMFKFLDPGEVSLFLDFGSFFHGTPWERVGR